MKKPKASLLFNLIVALSIALAAWPAGARAKAPAIETHSAPAAAQPPFQR